ncbi:MAG: hypothetical protein EOM23_03440 [Candidatus Moranbacteria bacterium]|nr:hypothetical protein [Candidatus Moranbacteria bacterium]
MLDIIILSISVPFLVFLLLRRAYLRKIVLTTEISHLEKNNVYYFVYVHGLLFRRYFTLTIKEDDEKAYILRKTIFYGGNKSMSISVFQNGIAVYTVDLKSVVSMDFDSLDYVNSDM